ncbi:hypothetical protein AVEN_262954-1 [Araneus ventricosus]|uniref:Uncharacterized protein n=1 Tax=Araneus ventricosus TaxID=182803 RepID=A0A4Y2DG73_ARAVE|nr:hypothetical protein AVEN_262954-1 [Araneus ventricosus]
MLESNAVANELPRTAEFYHGKSIFFTGAAGFVGSRPERKGVTGRDHVCKRWCPEFEVNANSNSSLNTNLKCLKLEEACNDSIRSQEKYNDESKSPTYVIIDTNALTGLFKNQLCNTCNF